MKNDHKKAQAPNGMRPLSAFKKASDEVKPAPKPAAAPAAASPSKQAQGTVSTLTEQNKVSEGITAQQTPIRAAEQQQAAAVQTAAATEKKKTEASASAETPAEPKLTSVTQSLPKYRSITETIPAATEAVQQEVAAAARTSHENRKPNDKSKKKVTDHSEKTPIQAPDLSVKAEREEFFSRYFTPGSVSADQVSEAIKRQEARRETQRRILENQQKARNAAENAPQRPAYDKMQTATMNISGINNYWNNPTAERPVVSHARTAEDFARELEAQTAGETAADQPEQISSEMSENIENAVSAKRKASNEKMLSKRLKRSDALGSAVQTVILGGVIIISGLIFLLGSSDSTDSKPAKFPDFSIDSMVRGEYAAGVTGYYEDMLPVKSSFRNAAASIASLFGFSSDEDTAESQDKTVILRDDDPAETTEAVTEASQPVTTEPTIPTETEPLQTEQVLINVEEEQETSAVPPTEAYTEMDEYGYEEAYGEDYDAEYGYEEGYYEEDYAE